MKIALRRMPADADRAFGTVDVIPAGGERHGQPLRQASVCKQSDFLRPEMLSDSVTVNVDSTRSWLRACLTVVPPRPPSGTLRLAINTTIHVALVPQ